MRLAVLADIHANLPALERVEEHIDAWQPDRVVVAGDIINRGPRPLECLDRMLDRRDRDGWILLRGNHEEYVSAWDDPPCALDAPEYPVFRGAHWTWEQLPADRRLAVAHLPLTVELESPSGGRIVVTHGSLHGTTAGIFPWVTRSELQAMVDLDAELFLVAHTHCPLITRIGSTRVVNVGSVGLPFDGDARACYGRFECSVDGSEVTLVRMAYDGRRAEQDFRDSGFLERAGPLARVVLSELRTSESRLFQWMERYFGRVSAGEVSAQDAVDEFLADLDE